MATSDIVKHSFTDSILEVLKRHFGEYAEALIAVWDGKSPGTRSMIEYMKSLNKPVYVYQR